MLSYFATYFFSMCFFIVQLPAAYREETCKACISQKYNLSNISPYFRCIFFQPPVFPVIRCNHICIHFEMSAESVTQFFIDMPFWNLPYHSGIIQSLQNTNQIKKAKNNCIISKSLFSHNPGFTTTLPIIHPIVIDDIVKLKQATTENQLQWLYADRYEYASQ